MADIFISYASKDRPTARRLAEALEARGWSVWWDYRGLRGGQPFDRIIEEEISKARAVIVVWSQNAIQSDWVRAEASHGFYERKLAPVRIDSATLPLRFMNIHTIDLSSWTGQAEAEPFERLLETLSEYLGPPKKAEQPERRSEVPSQAEPTDAAAAALPKRKPVRTYVLAVLATAGVLMLGVGVVMLGERQEVSPPEPPTEATLSKPRASRFDVVAAIQAAYVDYKRGDYETALSLARPAADQGNAAAQNLLGLMYKEGRGVPQDDAQAVQWYRKAAAQAVQWYRKAAAQAVQWYRKAAEQGEANAQFNLGWMYEKGRGVAQDDAEAVYWYRKAAQQGHAGASMWLDTLAIIEKNERAIIEKFQ